MKSHFPTFILLACVATAAADSAPPTPLSEAQANAKLALTKAIEELQKTAGLDQRVTARADILDPAIARPLLTGVWNSWEIDAAAPPAAADYERPAKDARFISWLVSSPDPAATQQVDFADQPPIAPVTLLASGTLGFAAPSSGYVTASKVPVPTADGSYAWAVLDEGVKVRINTAFTDAASSPGEQTQQLGSGERPATESLPGLAGLASENFQSSSPNFADLNSGIGNENFVVTAEQLSPGAADALKPLTHDISLNSLGVFSDTARGGLKQDFSLLAENSDMPASLGIYQSRLGIDVPSDPTWGSLQQFANLHHDPSRLSDSAGQPVLRAQGPAGWRSSIGANPTTGAPGTIITTPPSGVVLMPTIAKVQMVFSLATRDVYKYPKLSDTSPIAPGNTRSTLHNPWATTFPGTGYDYLLSLIYTPVVTLHNPYNVALEFRELKVMFGNVPFALKVFRNGQAQTSRPAPLDTMFYQGAESGQISKRFGMTLKTNSLSGTPASSTFRLLPGEVILFSPYINPNLTYASEFVSTRYFLDWDNSPTRTTTIQGIPGWRGDGIGFTLDWLCPTYAGQLYFTEVKNGKTITRRGAIPAGVNDEFHVEFAPLSVPSLSNNKFTVEIFAQPVGSASQISSGTIQLNYGTPTGLQNASLGNNGTIRYPENGTINTMAMHSHSTSKIGEIATTHPFALVSFYAKTTFGGSDPSGEDGNLATKPWSFGHGSIGASATNLTGDGMANGSHEFSIISLEGAGGTSNALQFDPVTGRGNSVTGLTGFNGQKFGVLYDIPLAPIQSLASLNGANPAGSSGFLPRFAQPIGNSWAHPMLDPANVITSGTSYPLADHSFLLNLALYDHYYFSGLGDQSGPLGSGLTTPQLASQFAETGLLDDPRLLLYRPKGKTAAEFPAEVSKPSAPSNTAAWQLMKGAFNVNSTSVPAWKAMLASIHDSQAIYSSLSGTSTSFENLDPTDRANHETRISRFRLPVSESTKDGAAPDDAYWLGAREYSGEDITLLAENIVEQVRQRGPFLSMAEFVNRQLGTSDKAQMGALQQAIDDSDLNTSLANNANAGYEIPAAAVTGYNYANPVAGSGPSYQGAPGFLTQADLLGVLGNAATVRSDTFTIRCYGEKTDANGLITAKATCEAVVQRLPDWVDPTEPPTTQPSALQNDANKILGRGFRIIALRWLADEEI